MNFRNFSGIIKSIIFFIAISVVFSSSLQAAEITIGTGTSTWGYPLATSYHDARTQTIYLASEIGTTGNINALSLYVTTVPGQTMNNFTIRMKHTDLSSYGSPGWDFVDWTVVYQANKNITSTGWVQFVFTTPFEYNGTQNLMVDISFNNSSYTTDGLCCYSTPGGMRTQYYGTNSSYGDPLTWSGRTPVPNMTANVPNIKLIMISFPPTVEAGENQVTDINYVQLNGTVQDDGLPNPPGKVTTIWSKVSGPGTVTFEPNSSVLNPIARFSTFGEYVLKLTANDGESEAYDIITITYKQNDPPVVNAGTDQNGIVTGTVNLNGSVEDDGLPNPLATVTTVWSKVSGPGTVTFEPDANVLNPTARFTVFSDSYVLRLSANDGQYEANDTVTITYKETIPPSDSYIVADIDDNGDVDFKDLKEVIDSWLITDPYADLYIDSDNKVNFRDFSVLNTLWKVDGSWLAEFISPDPAQPLSGTSVTFEWFPGQNVEEYYLRVGTTGTGSSNIFSGSTGTNMSQYVTGLPVGGSTVYVRLSSKIKGVWCYNDYTYTAMSANLARMIIPTPLTELPPSGAPLTGTTVFQWTAGTDITSYSLDIGTTPGGSNIYHGSDTTNKAQKVAGLPTNGSTVYVRLWSKSSLLPGGAQYIDYQYVSYNNLTSAPKRPAIKGPVDYNSVGAVTSTNLKVKVTDPESSPMSVTFYGREVSTTNDFRFIVYGDTQWWSWETEWMRPMFLHTAEVAISLNPSVILHVGDIVNDGDNNEAQWYSPNETFAMYDALNIPCLLTVGNHDQKPNSGSCTAPAAMYKKYFPISRYSSRPYWGGYYSSDSENRWIKFSAGGMDFMVVSIEYNAAGIPSDRYTWAKNLFASNSNRRGILLTHSILNSDGTWNTSQSSGLTTYNNIAPYSNVFMMLSGHHIGYVHRNEPYGNRDVHAMLFNYQDTIKDYYDPTKPIDYYGGWMRILEFSPTTNQIQVRTIRTWVNPSYRPNPAGYAVRMWDVNENNRFTLNYNMNNSPSTDFSVVGTANNVPSGNEATVTWNNLQVGRTYEWFAIVSDGTSKRSGCIWRFRTTSP